MVTYHIPILPQPAAGLERANQVVVTAGKRTLYLGLDTSCTSPKTSHIPIVWWHCFLFHLVCVFYSIVACAVGFPYPLQPGAGSQVPQVAGSTDAIPRFANPVLHRFVYSCATYQYVDVWTVSYTHLTLPTSDLV